MTPESWQRVKTLLGEALDIDQDARETFVLEASGGDVTISREVLNLLAATTQVDDFIEEPALRLLADADSALAPGTRIGAYEVVREIGHGGMGAVYLADRADQEFAKAVAIKVLRRGMSSDEIVQRFRLERQILANLVHPNIAGLLDGGTAADGVSYFVMEYVEGLPIDDYCRAGGLAEKARLELFCTVCAAVHFAHQNLVVHRDLKPANILVTSGGVPKLLDFGIAKLLQTDQPLSTQVVHPGLRLMTPEYASPEQKTGGKITTSTDVYALGVLLHLLLVDRLPDTAPTPEAPALRGDLANIVAMCTREEPARRYASAQSLADDIGRYLTSQTVVARKDTWSYRSARFIRRHRAAVSVAAAVAVLIVSAAITTTISWRNSVREQKEAEAVSSFLTDVLDVSDPNVSHGETIPLRAVLDQAGRRIDERLKDQPESRATVEAKLAKVYSNMGLHKQALPLAEQAVAVRRGLLGRNDPLLAESLHLEVEVRHELGDLAGAVPLLQEALAIQRHNAHGDDDPEFAAGLNNLGSMLESLDRLPEAQQVLRQALEMKRRLSHGDSEAMAMGFQTYGHVLLSERRYRQAEWQCTESLAMRRRIVGDVPDRFTALSLNTLGAIHEGLGELPRAESEFREALAMRRKLYGDEPNREVARSLTNLGRVRALGGDGGEAETLYRDALSIYGKLRDPDRNPDRAATLRSLAALLAPNSPSQCEPLAREAVAILQKNPPGKWQLADAQSVLGGCLAGLHRFAEAEPLLVGGYRELAQQQGNDDPSAKEAAARVADLYGAWNQTGRAGPWHGAPPASGPPAASTAGAEATRGVHPPAVPASQP